MNNVIRDVVFRTNGELYIGVVGSVRVGKSTFIRKFIETKVSPYVTDESIKNKLIDDLPQSSEGKTIMTVEPKFVPSNPVNISVNEEMNLNIRLVDCVGYIIPSSKGYVNEDGTPRLVNTPWKADAIPFEEAAYLGTKKVIENHSHIGILLTSDGSFGEFSRSEYQNVEEKLVEELKELNKPFVIVLNTVEPNSEETKLLCNELESKYDVNIVPINILDISENDIDLILEKSLEEFEITKLNIVVPNWLNSLDNTFVQKQIFNDLIDSVTIDYRKFKHVEKIMNTISQCELCENVVISNLDSGTGEITINIEIKEDLYNDILKEILGEVMDDKGKFIEYLQTSKKALVIYDEYKEAIETSMATGYGIATPSVDKMVLCKPEVIKQGARYGIKLKATAPSIHMIKVDVESSFEPIIGSEEQSKLLLDKINNDFDKNPEEVWNSAIFGRKLCDVVNDGIKAKLYMLSEESQYKFRESLEKVINKGRGGILAFII